MNRMACTVVSRCIATVALGITVSAGARLGEAQSLAHQCYQPTTGGP